MPDVSDYPDAVRRILDAEVDPNAVTQAEIQSALQAANAPQITAEVARGVADNALTVEKVRAAVESSGELPSEAEIDTISELSDAYDMGDRQEAVANASRQQIATVEDVRVAVESEREQASSQGDPIYREDVDDAIGDVERSKDILGASRDSVVDGESKRVGAPTREQVRNATGRAAIGEQVTPRDVLGDSATEIEGVGEKTADTALSVINDESGDPVAVAGQQGVADAVGRELGVESVGIGEVRDRISLQQESGRARLTFNGKTIEEIDV